jgi:hypothetical protein
MVLGEEWPRLGSRRLERAAQFVAVQMTQARNPTLMIELISQSGERMRIESAGALDLAGIVQSFCRRS